MNEHLLVGDRAERYPLDVESRLPIYVRPGIHPDPNPTSRFESVVSSSFAAIGRLHLDAAAFVVLLLAALFAVLHGLAPHH
jgi:hypothetical protein